VTDRFVVRAVALGLVAAFVGCLGGIVYLAHTGSNHDVLDNLAAVALGALAGFLAKTNTEVQQVQVTNPVSDPVATTDVPAKPRRRADKGHSDLVTVAVVLLVVILVLFLIGAIR
jgi:hypothetical protein